MHARKKGFVVDAARFDRLARSLTAAGSRRGLLALLATLPLLGGVLAPLGLEESAAKKRRERRKDRHANRRTKRQKAKDRKRGKRKVTLCLDGQALRVKSKRVKKRLRQGATRGPCSPCVPDCAGKPCGTDNGCGGTCGCAADSLCHEGVCQACTVTCPGGVCDGALMQAALDGGGTVYACPGRYVHQASPTTSFLLGASVTLIGAGDGEDETGNTILDANGSGRVLEVAQDITVALHGLRITAGSISGHGGGALNAGRLTLTNCTVAENAATSGAWGGGIYNEATGTLTLAETTVADNTAGAFGGGILNIGGASGTVEISNSTISGNSAGDGGGIFNNPNGTVIFSGDQGNTVTGNTAVNSGGGIYSGGVVTVLSAITVTRNRVNNSSGGGIFNWGTLTFSSPGSTVSGNTANIGGGIGNSGTFNGVGNVSVCGNMPDNCAPDVCTPCT